MEAGPSACIPSPMMQPPTRRGGTNVLEVLLTGAAIGASVYALTRIHVLEERVRQLSSTTTPLPCARRKREKENENKENKENKEEEEEEEEEERVHGDRESSDESDDEEEGPPPPEGNATPPPPSMSLRRGRRSDS